MSGDRLKILTVEEIEQERVLWLAEPYIPLGKITLVNGNPGVGKSTCVLAIAADLTNGVMFTKSDIAAPSAVIYQTAEDSYADTVKPRLRRLGADCSLVCVIDEREYPLSLADERIEQAITRTGAKMAIFDCLQAYCIGSDMHSANGMRPLMKRLGDVAERTGCAVILISHLRKSGGQFAYRGLGSIDIHAAARSVLTVGKLPLDGDMRAIVHTKSNLSPLAPSQAFGLDGNGGFCRLGDCDATVDDVMSGSPKAEGLLSKASRLLRETLSRGAVPAAEIKLLAEREGISFKTFKRAKETLGVISVKRDGRWFWDMPVIVDCEDAEDIQEGQTDQEGQANALVPLGFFEPQTL